MREHLQPWYDRWLKEHEGSDLRYIGRDPERRPQLPQVHFVRDTLAGLLWADVPYDQRQPSPPRDELKETAYVVGEHTSKSVRLPVYSLERPDLGLIVTLRDNYHDWNVSVSQETAKSDLRGFPVNDLRYCFFQGFPADRRFGTYAADPLRFSMCLDSEHQVYTLLWLLLRETR